MSRDDIPSGEEYPTPGPSDQLTNRVTLYPLQQSVALMEEVGSVRITDVRVQGTGDTVPFRFDRQTGTLDLPVPDRIPQGRPVEVFYEYVHDLNQIPEPSQEVYGHPAEPELPLLVPRHERRVAVAEVHGGAYRSATVTTPVLRRDPPPRMPWYKRALLAVFGWLHQHFGPE